MVALFGSIKQATLFRGLPSGHVMEMSKTNRFETQGCLLATTTCEINSRSLLRWISLALLFFANCFAATCFAQSPITTLVFSSDSKWVLTGSQQGVAISSWPELKTSRTVDCGLDSIHTMAMSKDGKRLYIGGGSPGQCGVVQLRDWPELKLERTWNDHLDVVYAISLSEDGKEWCSASWSGDCKVYALDAASCRNIVTAHSAPLFAANFISNYLLVTTGVDRTIVLSDTRSGKSLNVLKQHTKTVHALACQPRIDEGQPALLASASDDRTVRFWQAEIGRLVRFHRFESIPRAIAWTNAGDKLMVGCDDGTVWQLDPLSLATMVIAKQKTGIQNLLVDPNSDKLVISFGASLSALRLSDRH